jgi:site-specific DNA recombinase
MRDSAHLPERRCAVYTRKSSEEGLEQDFNSLDAQREACDAYIKSQKHEGWRALSARYDDGGYSGGSMERPALQRLLADIKAKKVDIVVVYKVDRLTRSLADFAKIVEVFDASEVSFVSVTQSFNTTTSMGRLTLNVLLSFAQFEREVTGERIRDKIAASKKKGLWMGGFVPFGFRAKDRTLAIDQGEAETVRLIFHRYLELGTVSELENDIAERDLRTRAFTSANSNRPWGNRPFSRGHLYKMLSNPIYAGKIAHKDKVYDGQHAAIIDRKTFAAVQARLSANTRGNRTQARAKEPNALAGLLVDANGTRLTSAHTVKDGKRYRYYAGNRPTGDDSRVWRLPASELEEAVFGGLERFLADQQRVASTLNRFRLQTRGLQDALRRTAELREYLNALPSRRETALKLIKEVVISKAEITVELDLAPLMSAAPASARALTHRLKIPIDLARRNGAIVIASTSDRGSAPDPALVKALARGFAWFEELATGRADTVTAIAKRHRVTDRYVSQLVELAFIDPRIVQRVLAGTARGTISTTNLVFRTEMPPVWAHQAPAIFAGFG